MTDQKRDLSPAEVAKIEAETKKLTQELALEAKKGEAEVRKLAAEALKAEREAEQLEIGLTIGNLERKALVRAHEEADAADKYNHVYHFNTGVDSASVDACIKRLNIWRRTGAQEIEIIFSSPGGSVVDGLLLYDHIQILRREGIRIVTGSLGMAASMAGILLQAGDHRWIGKEAWVLIHQVQAGMMGTFGQMEDRIKWLDRIQERILDIFAARAAQAGKKGTATSPLDRETLANNWQRKDWWLSSDECLAGGIVDEVR